MNCFILYSQLCQQQLSNEQLIQAANEFGTPLYVYHAEKIKEQYEKLTTAFSNWIQDFFMPQGADQYQYSQVYKSDWLQY